jgi:hypothetical protein
MAVPIIGNAGVVAEVDENRNLAVQQNVIPGYPAAGGFYSVSGHTTAAVAAALAADVMLMSARMATGSTRKAYITKLRLHMWCILLNAAGVDLGILGFRRFTAVTPTGGNARTSQRYGPAKGTISDITDIRDLNAALTGAPTFGADGIICQAPVPAIQGAIAAGMANAAALEYVFDFPSPIELAAGDGVALRTIKACPATVTWGYSYTMHWFER